MMRYIQAAALAAAMGYVLAAPGSARADFDAGVNAYQAEDYKAALDAWLLSAADGDPRALFNLGQMYRTGKGVEANLAIAEQYYRRAAALGHVEAQANLGVLYFSQSPPRADDALRVWEQAARRGHAQSQFLLGVQYFNGEYAPRDVVRAYAWISLAADAGYGEAVEAMTVLPTYLTPEDITQGQTLAAEMRPQHAPATVAGAAVATDLATDKPVSASADNPAAPVTAVDPTPPIPDAGMEEPSAPAAPIAAEAVEPESVDPAAPPENMVHRVQFAVMADETGAETLRKTLFDDHGSDLAGGDVTIEKIDAGEVMFYRVRSGPLASAAQAEALCAAVIGTAAACTPLRSTRVPVVVAVSETQDLPPPAGIQTPASPPDISDMPETPDADTQKIGPSEIDTAPAVADLYRVQVAAHRSTAEAEAHWTGLRDQHPDLLGSHRLYIHEIALAGRGIYFRAQAGPFGARQDANRLCTALKQRKVDCLVIASPP